MKTSKAILFSTMILSCGPSDRNFTIDPSSFSEDQQGIIKAAARSWDPILKDPITTNGGEWKVVRGLTPPPTTAFTDTDNQTITVSPAILDEELFPVMLHEFGHSVGFAHHNEQGVMNPDSIYYEFSKADLDQCSHLHRCR